MKGNLQRNEMIIQLVKNERKKWYYKGSFTTPSYKKGQPFRAILSFTNLKISCKNLLLDQLE